MNIHDIKDYAKNFIEVATIKPLFRITKIDVNASAENTWVCKATLFNDEAVINVVWISDIKPENLIYGDVVKANWLTRTIFKYGTNIIQGLDKVKKIGLEESIFHTIPHSWIRNRKVFNQFVKTLRGLDSDQKLIIENILLKSDVLYRFLTSPFQLTGPYSQVGGNIEYTLMELSGEKACSRNKKLHSIDLKNNLTAIIILGIGRNKQYKFDSARNCFKALKQKDSKVEAMNLIMEAIKSL